MTPPGEILAGGPSAIRAPGTVHRGIGWPNVTIPGDTITAAKLIDCCLATDAVGTAKSTIGESGARTLNDSAPWRPGRFCACPRGDRDHGQRKVKAGGRNARRSTLPLRG
ncbi:hypothetical protein [Paracoccus spongiarum]|uniref:Uncharacterized protein n=1 Tax=Paracoccus spongiarum TaxID=3064387 RepID=A0ABT9JC36_9RHOB|nr:hypothetical protein [Paracoccus sp. 2205BS29-5]MDP5307393.1 hypothetical protein [Paracoccus sp. 2205BS29-5]